MSAAGAAGPTRLATASWVVYDLANTIFALGVVGLYFSDWLLEEGHADSLLAGVQIAAAAVVIFLAPWVGARSDVLGRRVPALVVTTILAVAGTAILATGPVWLTALALWLAVVSVNTGSVVYDALLVDVSTEENRGRISGYGVGVGYVGSFIGLGLGLLALDVLDWGFPGVFRLIAIAFLVFAIPSFVFVKERPGVADAALPSVRDIVVGLRRSWRTASRYDGVVPFLVGRFFYTDAINTLIGGFLAIFVIDELGLDRGFFTALMGVAITAAIVGGLASGRFIERHGPMRVLRVVLVMWMLAIAAGVVAAITGMTNIAWVIGPLGGIALGATWSADRVVMVRVSPPAHLGEFYGLYATVGRFATILGPLVWAVIVDVIGLPRTYAMGALIVFIAIGWVILRRVDDGPRDWPTRDLLVAPDPAQPRFQTP
ncbi:MAG TPA: MFS transporter [Acidimicrobiia bacterium]|nr:MFS transporter [Acidimicrobiia bacterium]